MAKKDSNFTFKNEDVARADATAGLEYRDNGKLWVYEVQKDDRWVPTVTQTFRTRREARNYVAPLREAGLNVRIARYARTAFDRF